MSGAPTFPPVPDHKLIGMIATVSREVTKREVVYPRWVESGRMSQRIADEELSAMKDVLAYLQQARAGQER